MRIGILTFHRALNYGALLQCYALQRLLTDWGHDVVVVDYRQPYIEAKRVCFSLKQLFAMKGFDAKIDYFKKRNKRKSQVNNAKVVFDDFIANILKTTHKCDGKSIPPDLDAYIIGSDQLWSENCLGGKFDDVYLAKFKHKDDAMIIGYAISVNRQSLFNIAKNYPNLIGGFNSLSLREKFAVDEISKIAKSKVSLTIDPTLLLDENVWDNIASDKYKDEKYILIYQVRGTRYILSRKARHLAHKYNLNLVGASNQGMKITDFLSAIKYAQCIITTSFHATAFAVIFNKPFYTFTLNDGKDDRYVELIHNLNLDNHLVDINEKPEEMPLPLPRQLRHELTLYRTPSIEFLKNAINGQHNYI